jgi:hypothetical protein
MKQGEQITASLGTGAVILNECSNDPIHRIPIMTIMLPAWEEVRMGDSFAIHHPAKSMELHASQVERLYAFLKGYYQP